MARQQYLSRPSASITFFGSSPFLMRSVYSSQRWAIGFPQLQHRIGIIMVSPVRLLHFRPRLRVPVWLCRLFSAHIRNEQLTIIGKELLPQLLVFRMLDKRFRDDETRGVRLGRDPAAKHIDTNINCLGKIASQQQWLLYLHTIHRRLIDIQRYSVDGYYARARIKRRTSDCPLAFS